MFSRAFANLDCGLHWRIYIVFAGLGGVYIYVDSELGTGAHCNCNSA